ncbi:MAG: carboxypeptidase-like regulatory domain-containing protein [Flavobacteriales bacterium]
MNKAVLLLSLLCLFVSTQAQRDPTKDLIQLSGVVVSGDSLTPVPFTSVFIKGTNRGTMCDFYGFFSLVVKKNDTIEFSSVGYTASEVLIEDTLSDTRYSMIQMLKRDTLELPEQVIYPWPTREQFREAFLSLNAPYDDYDRAFENLTREDVRLAIQGMPMTGREGSSYAIQREYTRLYQIGQMPQISLLNPLAWAQFIEAWKRGDYSKK